MAEKRRSGGRDTPGPQVAAWEWVAAAVGLVLVLGTAGYLVWDAAGSERAGPEVALEAVAVAPAGDSYRVEFRARNRGGRTAAQVLLEGSLRQDGVTVETSRAVLDYLPARSEQTGGLFFSRDPAGYELVLRALGYQDP